MYDPKRIPVILDALREVWEMIPDRQFNSLMFNVIKGTSPGMSDQELIEKIADFKAALVEQNKKTEELLKRLK